MECKILVNTEGDLFLSIVSGSEREFDFLKKKKGAVINVTTKMPFHTDPAPSLCDTCVKESFPPGTTYSTSVKPDCKNYRARCCSGKHTIMNLSIKGEKECVHYEEKIPSEFGVVLAKIL